jgi:hypothetical protein
MIRMKKEGGLHTATSCAVLYPIHAWHLFVLKYSRERLIKARNWLEFALKPSYSPSIPPVCIMTCPSGNKWSASCTLLLIASWLDGNFFLSVLADFCHWNNSLLPQSGTVETCCLYVMPNKRTHHRRLACHSATAMSCVKVKSRPDRLLSRLHCISDQFISSTSGSCHAVPAQF